MKPAIKSERSKDLYTIQGASMAEKTTSEQAKNCTSKSKPGMERSLS